MEAEASTEIHQQQQSIQMRLKVLFAALSAMGGLVLASGTDGSALSVIAVFFALFGLVFVDWLEFFALPAIAAYAAMGVAAMFCVGDFVELNAPGQHQMTVVAQLLVFVQAILMLQKKNRRIFEQLAVFCLLELVVSAVFNDAMLFGLLLIPIALVGASALALISANWAREGVEGEREHLLRKKAKTTSVTEHIVRLDNESNWVAFLSGAPKISRVVLWMLAPGVLLISIIFFYALPRTTEASRVESNGKAMVGFSDELRLGQIGKMMQSSAPALRVDVRDRETGAPYNVVGGIYLRGKVMERYEEFNSLTLSGASWNSLPKGKLTELQGLPEPFIPAERSDIAYYDAVDVKITCESMRSNALFAIAPYDNRRAKPSVLHSPEQWTLSRKSKSDWLYPRIEYRFGTNAFQAGVQSDLVCFRQQGSSLKSTGTPSNRTRLSDADNERWTQEYIQALLLFSDSNMPTIAKLAKTLSQDDVGKRKSDYDIAKSMERHFTDLATYQYSLDLNADPVPGMDPIEQFVRIDKRGHCQFFASALTMMLRSQGIPARIVAGYHTDEYNALARHFVARQLHAHAWVEALIDVNDNNRTIALHGQPKTSRAWLRLDPTPAGGRVRETGRTSQVLDLAQTVWDDYVVEMDAETQDTALLSGGSNSMNQSYRQIIDKAGLLLQRLRAGELGGGSLAGKQVFRWQTALPITLVVGILVILSRMRFVMRRRAKTDTLKSMQASTPSIDFYAEAVQIIGPLGIHRELEQTPKELSVMVTEKLSKLSTDIPSNAFAYLTDLFYLRRYGGCGFESGIAKNREIVDASASQGLDQRSASTEGNVQLDGQVRQALLDLKTGVNAALQHDSEGK
ncbi:MAG: transglutaminaseTgpA domain-containing protein [Rubripirellula sp.]